MPLYSNRTVISTAAGSLHSSMSAIGKLCVPGGKSFLMPNSFRE